MSNNLENRMVLFTPEEFEAVWGEPVEMVTVPEKHVPSLQYCVDCNDYTTPCHICTTEK